MHSNSQGIDPLSFSLIDDSLCPVPGESLYKKVDVKLT